MLLWSQYIKIPQDILKPQKKIHFPVVFAATINLPIWEQHLRAATGPSGVAVVKACNQLNAVRFASGHYIQVTDSGGDFFGWRRSTEDLLKGPT